MREVFGRSQDLPLDNDRFANPLVAKESRRRETLRQDDPAVVVAAGIVLAQQLAMPGIEEEGRTRRSSIIVS